MGIWSAWLDSIGTIVTALADAGLGLGLGIVVTTVLLRIALLPLAWPMAYRACIRQKKLAKLQPELRTLQERFRDQPELYVRKLTELYKANGLTMVDAKALLGALAQLPLFLGMFQVLRDIGAGARFLWVPNLLRPDVVLAVIAGLTTAVMTAVMISMNPDMPEQLRILLIVLPSVIAVVAALQFSSALAIYWATSNTFSALQTLALHAVVRRRVRSGAIKI
jgi:YidC/Oxa1 family membrane protein insertase